MVQGLQVLLQDNRKDIRRDKGTLQYCVLSESQRNIQEEEHFHNQRKDQDHN